MSNRVPSKSKAQFHVLILSGDRASGKSTLCERLAKEARTRGISAGGVVCPGIFDAEGVKSGCRARDIRSGEEWELGSRERDLGGPRWKNWSFSKEGFRKANRALVGALDFDRELIVVDEIGPVELTRGAGLYPFLRQLDARLEFGSAAESRIILIVRPELSNLLAQRYPKAIKESISLEDREEAYARILDRVLDPSWIAGC